MPEVTTEVGILRCVLAELKFWVAEGFCLPITDPDIPESTKQTLGEVLLYLFEHDGEWLAAWAGDYGYYLVQDHAGHVSLVDPPDDGP